MQCDSPPSWSGTWGDIGFFSLFRIEKSRMHLLMYCRGAKSRSHTEVLVGCRTHIYMHAPRAHARDVAIAQSRYRLAKCSNCERIPECVYSTNR